MMMEQSLLKTAVLGELFRRLDLNCNLNGVGDFERAINSGRRFPFTATEKKWSQFGGSSIVPDGDIDESAPGHQLSPGVFTLKVKDLVKVYEASLSPRDANSVHDHNTGSESGTDSFSDADLNSSEFSTVPSRGLESDSGLTPSALGVASPNRGLESIYPSTCEDEHQGALDLQLPSGQSYTFDLDQEDDAAEAAIKFEGNLNAAAARGPSHSISEDHEERQLPAITNDLHWQIGIDIGRSNTTADMKPEHFTITSGREQLMDVNSRESGYRALATSPELRDTEESALSNYPTEENRSSNEANAKTTYRISYDVNSARSVPFASSLPSSPGHPTTSGFSFRRSLSNRFRKLLSVTIACGYTGRRPPSTATRRVDNLPVRFLGKVQPFTKMETGGWEVLQDLEEAERTFSTCNLERTAEVKCDRFKKLVGSEAERTILNSKQEQSDGSRQSIKTDDNMKGSLVTQDDLNGCVITDDDLKASGFEDWFAEYLQKPPRKVKAGRAHASETVSSGSPLIRKMTKILRMSSKGFQGAKGIAFSIVQGMSLSSRPPKSYQYKGRLCPLPKSASGARIVLEQDRSVSKYTGSRGSSPASSLKRMTVSRGSSTTSSAKRSSASPATFSSRRPFRSSQPHKSSTRRGSSFRPSKSSNPKSQGNLFSGKTQPYTVLTLRFGESESAHPFPLESGKGTTPPTLPFRELPCSTVDNESADCSGDMFLMYSGRRRGRLAPSRFQREHLERLRTSKVSPVH